MPKRKEVSQSSLDKETIKQASINFEIIQPLIERYRAEMKALGCTLVIETDKVTGEFIFSVIRKF